MDFTFDYKKNLQALSGYRIANPKPLDARTVVNTRADIAEFASVVYPGLLVYVTSEKKFIVFNGTDWEDFKGSSSVDDSTITQIQSDINDIKGALDDKALASDLTALSNTVTEVQSALDGKASTGTVEALTGRVGAVEGSITSINEALGNKLESSDLDTINSSIESINSSIEGINTALDSKLEASDLSDLEGKVATLIGVDADKSVRTIAYEEVTKVVDGAPATFDTLKEIADWIESHPDSVAEINSRLTSVEDSVSTLSSTVAGLGTSVEGLESKDAELETSIGEATGKIETLEATIGNAESGLVKDAADNATAISTVDGKVDSLTGRVSANEGAIETLNGSVATLESDVTSLKEFKDTVLSKSTVLGVQVKTDAAGAFESALDENKVAKIDLSVYAKVEDVANLELTGSVAFDTIDSIIGGTFVTE